MNDSIKLGDIVQFINDRIPTNTLTLNTYISTANMLTRKRGVTKAEKLPTSKTTREYKEDDILISNIRLYFEKIWFADSQGGASSDVLVLRVGKDYIPQFIYYVLSDINFFNYADVTSKGTKMPRGDRKAILKYPIPKLGLVTQERITYVLSTYDELIENNNRRIELLEETAEEIYKEWFVRMRFPGYENKKFKQDIPIGWEIQKVGDIVTRLKSGHFYKQEELSEDGSIVVIDQSEAEYMGYHEGVPTHKSDIHKPIILFGDHSCKMLLMTQSFSLAENVIPFISNSANPEIFLYYATKGLLETQEYKRHWQELVNQKIFLPEIELQKKFEKYVKNNVLLIESYKEQNKKLIKQRDLLLPRLMNGMIKVK